MSVSKSRREFTHNYVTTILALAILASVPSTYAQDGPCCAMTDNVKASCNTTGCKGTITYKHCEDPFGTGSQHYKITEIKCCTETFTSFTTPSGGDQGCAGGLAIATVKPPTASDAGVYAEGVWVRTCAGKQLFVRST